MSSVNLVVVVESVRAIVAKDDDELSDFHLPSIIAVAAALGMCLYNVSLVKFLSPHSCQILVIRLLLLFAQKFWSSAHALGRS